MSDWRKCKEDKVESGVKKYIFQGGGRKLPMAKDPEDKLVQWTQNFQSKNLRVTRCTMQAGQLIGH